MPVQFSSVTSRLKTVSNSSVWCVLRKVTHIDFADTAGRIFCDVYNPVTQTLSRYRAQQLQHQRGAGVGDVSAVTEDYTGPLDCRVWIDEQRVADFDVALRREDVADFRNAFCKQTHSATNTIIMETDIYGYLYYSAGFLKSTDVTVWLTFKFEIFV